MGESSSIRHKQAFEGERNGEIIKHARSSNNTAIARWRLLLPFLTRTDFTFPFPINLLVTASK